MGETFKKLGQWVKEHKALAIASGGGILILIYLYYRSQQNAQNAAAQSAAQAASGQPSDAILSAEIQAQTALQQEQIAAQAQATQQGYQAQVDLATIQAQANASNAQNQAALTLGLAQAGDSASTILQLLGAQPGVATTTSTIGNTTTNPTTAATVTGAVGTTAGTGTNAQTNPAPVTALPTPTTPIDAALGTVSAANVDAWGNPVNCPPGMHYAGGACIYECNQNTVAGQWGCVQQNDAIWANAPNVGSTATSNPSVTVGTGGTGGVQPGSIYQGTTSAAPLPARGAVYQSSPPRLSAHSAIGDVASHTVTEADVTGTVGGSASIVTHAVWSTPPARANLADLMSQHAVVSPSVVHASGGPFYNPPQSDVIQEGYTVEGGGIMMGVHNGSPTDWNAIISSFGVRDAASVQASLHNLFGSNQPMPVTALGVAE